MDIFEYLNKRDVLRDMTDEEFAVFLPEFTDALLNYGFDPLLLHYNNSLKSSEDDWDLLCKRHVLENHISSTNVVGLSILKRNMPHIYEVQNYKGQSVLKSWTYLVLEKAIRVNRTSHSTPYISEIIRQIGFVSGTSKVTMYRPLLTKRIVSFFGATRILDVCIGWGGRMIGSACIPGVHYTGIEPCVKTFNGLMQICEELKLQNNVTLLNGCAEHILPTLEEGAAYDLAITSPPYYNLEVYSDETTQSHFYGTYTQWVESFLKPVVHGVLDRLTETGKSAWSVKNFKTNKQYNLYDDIVSLHEEKGWVKMDVEFYVGNPVRPGSNGGKEGKEITYVFQKGGEAPL
jgi:16S rRNA G966 N2-methylase RsmD